MKYKDSKGIALIVVIFIITIITIVVYSQAKSSYIGSRLIKTSEQQLQSEFLLKSSLNFARALIAADKGLKDPPKDKLWGMFNEAREVSLLDLGISVNNAILTLEIRADDGKLPIRALKSSGTGTSTTGNKWEKYFKNLFTNLGFNDDKQQIKSGKFKGKFFNSGQLIANLIDYMDEDNESFKGSPEINEKGIEGDLEDKFPNTIPEKINELFQIPGFTDKRINALASHVSFSPNLGKINVNFATVETILALDPTSDRAKIEELVNLIATDGSMDQATFQSTAPQYIKEFTKISSDINVGTKYFQVIAKVQYGDSRYFLRAFLERNSNKGSDALPDIRSYELIG